MMKRLYVLLFMLVLGLSLKAQVASSVLLKDSAGHYYYEQTALVYGASKGGLYNRLKGWVVNALDPSDTYLKWDESGHDSVSTVAYLEMSNSPYFISQLVDFKVGLYFNDGQVRLVATDFRYNASRPDGSKEVDILLEKSGKLGSAENYVMAEFDGYFQRLMKSFEATAKGRYRRK